MEPSPAPDAEMRLPGLIDSNPREALEAIENLLATPGLDPHYRVNLLTLAGHVAAVLDHRARATRHLRSALAGAKRLGDRKAEGRAHERLAHLAAREGALAHHRRDNAAAQAEFQTVLDIDDARPEAAADSDMARLRRREARIGAIGHLGDIEREAGTHAGAAEWRSRGVATARQSQNGADEVAMLLAAADAAPAAAPRLRAPVLASLGARQSEEGQPELARESMTAGIAPSNQIGDLGQAIGARRTLADFEGECGNWAAAIDLHEQAVQDAEKLDWKERRAGLHILTGDAIVNAQRTAKMRQELDADDDVPPVPLDTVALARAREHFEIASRLAQGKDQELIGMVAEDGLAEVAESLDDRAQRRQRFESLLAMARRAKAAGHEVSALLGPAALANRQGDAARPGALGAEVYRTAGRLGNPEAQIRVLTALAAHAAKAGDPARARDRHLMALKLAAKADDGDSLTAVGFLLSEVLADEDLAVGAA